MVFQVLRKSDNKCMFGAVSATVPYQVETLKIMDAAGYAFKVDGKILSLATLIKMCNETNDTRQAAPAINELSSSTSKDVKYVIHCIETDQCWDTQSQAAKALHIDPAQVSDSIKTGRKRSGYTFEKVAKE